jgi:NADH pyrophosphatase NudC (nudix superfamily)
MSRREASQALDDAIRDIFTAPRRVITMNNLDKFCGGCGYLLPVCHCNDPDPEKFEPLALDGVEVREPDEDDTEHRGLVEFATFREGEFVESIYVTRDHAAHLGRDLAQLLQPVKSQQYPSTIRFAMESLKQLASSLELQRHDLYAQAVMVLFNHLHATLVANGDAQ